ncbi:hypothetical protein C8R46DRAFT_1228663 [Mycena filopes]|nr:hypothetical protein C8R46DRAFT_1228663 [Mycena filopes]
MYRHIIILALPLLFILPSNSAPLEGRVSTPPVTFKVLVPSSDAPSRRAPPKAPVVPVAPTTKQDLVCSDAQRLRIAQGLKDAYTLAGKASAALTPASVTSNAVTTYLGPIAPDKLAAQAQLRYTNVQSSITSSPKVTYVDTLDISGKDKSVYLLCVTGPVQAKAMGCGSTSPASPAGASDAMTINIGDSEVKDGPPEKFTSITFCPNFFNTQTLAQDTAAYTANKKKGDNAWNTFPRPRSAGVVRSLAVLA